MSDGQYTLDADPAVLARRLQKLELAYDGLTAVTVGLVDELRLVAYQCELATSEGYPLQSARLNECIESINALHVKAHAVSTLLGRSYA